MRNAGSDTTNELTTEATRSTMPPGRRAAVTPSEAADDQADADAREREHDRRGQPGQDEVEHPHAAELVADAKVALDEPAKVAEELVEGWPVEAQWTRARRASASGVACAPRIERAGSQAR